MNLRLEALAANKLQYNSGKPCRKGHMADRYTSNGMCVDCLKQQNEARKDLVKDAKIRRNMALFASLREHVIMVRMADRDTANEFADVLQYSSAEVREQVHKFIHQLYVASPTPRALSREDLMVFMDYRGGVVHNVKDLELSHQENESDELCIIRNGVYYNAQSCMDVLRGNALNVKPTIK